MTGCRLAVCAVLFGGLLAGCRCCPLMTPYANVIDDVSDTHVYFDDCYRPRWDVSREGKPDWVGTDGRRLRRSCCVEGQWDRYDDCHLYPPAYPYQYPGHAMPEPSIRQASSSAAEPPSSPPMILPPAPAPIE